MDRMDDHGGLDGWMDWMGQDGQYGLNGLDEQNGHGGHGQTGWYGWYGGTSHQTLAIIVLYWTLLAWVERTDHTIIIIIITAVHPHLDQDVSDRVSDI